MMTRTMSKVIPYALLLLLAGAGCAGKQTPPIANPAVAAPPTVAAPPAATVDDQTLVQGKWSVAKAEVDGRPYDELASASFAITGNTMFDKTDEKSEETKFILRSSSSPKEFEFMDPESGAILLKGTYTVEGDNFTLTWSDGRGRMLLVLKR
jgi:uncharacterized protein (TIGR03067 family)